MTLPGSISIDILPIEDIFAEISAISPDLRGSQSEINSRVKAEIPFWAMVCGGTRIQACLCGIVKRAMDITVSSVLMVVLAPLLLLVAAAVKLTTPGAALFQQTRVGLNGNTFSMYKFRTMAEGAEASQGLLAGQNEAGNILFKIRNDPRITELGRIMRRTSLDELPQLFNVLMGEMSLVGPRPAVPGEVARYTPKMLQRLFVKPGMTGIWQVSGRSEIPHLRAFALDIWYANKWSVVLDLAILINTIPAVLSRRGAF